MPLVDLEGIDFDNADDDSSDSEDEDLEEHQQIMLQVAEMAKRNKASDGKKRHAKMTKKRKELEDGWKARTQELMSKEKRHCTASSSKLLSEVGVLCEQAEAHEQALSEHHLKYMKRCEETKTALKEQLAQTVERRRMIQEIADEHDASAAGTYDDLEAKLKQMFEATRKKLVKVEKSENKFLKMVMPILNIALG